MATSERAKATLALLAALDHPARRQILRAMAGRKAVCPRELSEELGRPLDNLSYHVRVLAHCGAAKLIRTERVSGSTKHLYRSSVRAGWAQTVLEATRGEGLGDDQ
ncbi:MAG TPA: helix-turn-helix domain-containing protein [Solirubrobacterales bacterium]|nr:helix-turn-helix domain-containing protein [Solirubrobacterales bacterium]